MRRTNWRMAVVGIVLLVAAAAFFVGMLGAAPGSNNPVALMQTVGQVSGVVGSIGLVLAVIGLIGRRMA
jgi:hypothetical protein